MRSERGQGTVEWLGAITLVLALLVALGAAGVRAPGTGLAEAIVAKVEWTLGEDSRCGAGSQEPALVRAYGARLAADVRAHAPEVDYEEVVLARPPRCCSSESALAPTPSRDRGRVPAPWPRRNSANPRARAP